MLHAARYLCRWAYSHALQAVPTAAVLYLGGRHQQRDNFVSAVGMQCPGEAGMHLVLSLASRAYKQSSLTPVRMSEVCDSRLECIELGCKISSVVRAVCIYASVDPCS